MKRYYKEIYSKYIESTSPLDGHLFYNLYDEIIHDLSLCPSDSGLAVKFINGKLVSLIGEYEAQPVRFTEEYSVFCFMKSEIPVISGVLISENISENIKAEYWLSFYFFVKSLVFAVCFTADEAQINRIQRALDRLCSSCMFLNQKI